MDAGDVLAWHGRLWRQQENQRLDLSPELVAAFPPRLQELVGHGTYMGLIGHIEQRPAALSPGNGEKAGERMLWEHS